MNMALLDSSEAAKILMLGIKGQHKGPFKLKSHSTCLKYLLFSLMSQTLACCDWRCGPSARGSDNPAFGGLKYDDVEPYTETSYINENIEH